MATHRTPAFPLSTPAGATAAPRVALSFERVGATSAVLAGIVGLLYSIAFVVIARSTPQVGALLSALFLMLGGLLASAALVALYERVRDAGPGLATWALLLGTIAALGSAVHGGYDLANAINPPAALLADLPNQVDPRGLLTFGVSGLALLAYAALIGRSSGLPAGLSALGYALGAMLVVIYLGRLIVLDASSPLILIPAAATGFVVNPAWYVWLGLSLWRR
jgi:hypothetical protein